MGFELHSRSAILFVEELAGGDDVVHELNRRAREINKIDIHGKKSGQPMGKPVAILGGYLSVEEHRDIIITLRSFPTNRAGAEEVGESNRKLLTRCGEEALQLWVGRSACFHDLSSP